ncbi:MAG: hypothetical protein VKM97_00125 [Cyanobacteriota bacterium]|nr:hypothetical protein [Cyanobacteriota bacterium]
MAATRLTDSQKRELVARYCAGEASQDLAEAYGCSMNTVSRAVKASMPPEDYERLKQARARASRSSVPSPEAAPGAGGIAAAEGDVEPAAVSSALEELRPAPAARAPLDGDDGAQDDEAEGSLAIDDADDFGDDSADEDGSDEDGADEDGSDDGGADDEGEGAEGSDDGPELPAASVRRQPVSCVPIAEAELPASVYMLVDKTVELEARPLADFSDLGALPPGEEHLQALQVFVNPRNAKRLCGRSQRVIKIPDTRIFERTARYLVAQGISRLVIENGVYSLPGA